MASSKELAEYIADQFQAAGTITYRKMFGEYGIFCGGTFFAIISGNQLFVKITKAGKKLAPYLEEEPPYEGAKPYFLVEEIDDREFMASLAVATCKELPAPKPRKKKGESNYGI